MGRFRSQRACIAAASSEGATNTDNHNPWSCGETNTYSGADQQTSSGSGASCYVKQATTTAPTTATPTTGAPTTAAPTTAAPTTGAPTTAPTTEAPTTATPTAAPTTGAPTTTTPTTGAPTTGAPTTAAPTTATPITLAPTPAPTAAAVHYIEIPGGGQCYNSGGWLPNFEQNGHTLATCQAKCTQFTDCVTVSLFTSGRCYGRFRSQSACIAAAWSEGATNTNNHNPWSCGETNTYSGADQQTSYESGASCYVKARNYIKYGLLVDEGKGLVAGTGYSLSGCKRWCDDTSGCQSFAYSAKHQQCDLKEKFVKRGEATHTLGEPYEDYKTYYVQRF